MSTLRRTPCHLSGGPVIRFISGAGRGEVAIPFLTPSRSVLMISKKSWERLATEIISIVFCSPSTKNECVPSRRWTEIDADGLNREMRKDRNERTTIEGRMKVAVCGKWT
jgi:hypothetical protein